MTAEKLFEEKKYLVIAAIKQQFGSIARAGQIAEMNNMELDDLIQVGHLYLWEHCVNYNPESRYIQCIRDERYEMGNE